MSLGHLIKGGSYVFGIGIFITKCILEKGLAMVTGLPGDTLTGVNHPLGHTIAQVLVTTRVEQTLFIVIAYGIEAFQA